MELHDDDTALFEIMLRFLYTTNYNKDEMNKLIGSEHDQRILSLVRLAAQADKYTANILLNASNCLLGNESQVLSVFATAIETHYSTSVTADTPVGRSIVDSVMNYRTSWTIQPGFRSLMLKYPLLGSDIALFHHDQGTIDVQELACPKCLKRIYSKSTRKFHRCQNCDVSYTFQPATGI